MLIENRYVFIFLRLMLRCYGLCVSSLVEVLSDMMPTVWFGIIAKVNKSHRKQESLIRELYAKVVDVDFYVERV